MEIRQYATALWNWLWLIALATILAGGLSYWSSSRLPAVYQATATVRVGQFLQSTDPRGGDFATSQQLAQGYAQMVQRQSVLQGAIDELGWDIKWDTLARQVNGAIIAGSPLIRISVVDTDPLRAKVIADEVARQLILQSPTPSEQEEAQHREFIGQQLLSLQTRIEDAEIQLADLDNRMDQESSARGIQEIQNQTGVLQQKITNWQGTYARLLEFHRGSRTNYLSIEDPAPVPASPLRNNSLLNVLLAASVGFLIAAGGAILLEYLDNTIRSRDDIDHNLNLPYLGSVGQIHGVKQPPDSLITNQASVSSIAEMYRVLRTRLEFLGLRNSGVSLLVTSPGPGEGKTTTACNLAITVAQTGRRVILVDADLRIPSIHRFFGVPNDEGLSNLLVDDSLVLDELLLQYPQAGLRFLRSGPLPANPGELLNSEAMHQRLTQMREIADVIIIDSPAVLAAADATIVGAHCNGIILVVDAGHTRRDSAQQAKMIFDQVGLKIQGVVLNKHRIRNGAYHHYSSTTTNQVVGDATLRFGQDLALSHRPCPFIGLRTDPMSIVMGVSSQHRCRAAKTAQTIDPNHQSQFCLGGAFEQCPRFQTRSSPDSSLPTASARSAVVNGGDGSLPSGSRSDGDGLGSSA